MVETYIQKNRDITLDALVETITEHDRADARSFLSAMLDAGPPDMLLVTLPVASCLLKYEGWRENLTVGALQQACLLRREAIEYLRNIADQDYDAESEFLVGFCINLRDHWILPDK